MEYEWGVWCTGDNSLHRSGMTEEEAKEWVKEWDEMAENSKAKPNIFRVCRRPVGEWAVEVDGNYYFFTTA